MGRKWLDFCPSAALYIFALSAQVSGWNNSTVAVILAVIATVLLVLAFMGKFRFRWPFERKLDQPQAAPAPAPAPVPAPVMPPQAPVKSEPTRQTIRADGGSTIIMGNVTVYQNTYTSAATGGSTAKMDIFQDIRPQIDYVAIELDPSQMHTPTGIINSIGINSVSDEGPGHYGATFQRYFHKHTLQARVQIDPSMPYDLRLDEGSLDILIKGQAEPKLIEIYVQGVPKKDK